LIARRATRFKRIPRCSIVFEHVFEKFGEATTM